MQEKAYEMYLRTARLDLDNYNDDTKDGCHITSMAGSWMSIVEGFGGMRVEDGKLILNPFIPEKWGSFSFKVMFRGNLLKVNIKKHKVIITSENKKLITLSVNGKDYTTENEIEILS